MRGSETYAVADGRAGTATTDAAGAITPGAPAKAGVGCGRFHKNKMPRRKIAANPPTRIHLRPSSLAGSVPTVSVVSRAREFTDGLSAPPAAPLPAEPAPPAAFASGAGAVPETEICNGVLGGTESRP